ncbi:MAG: mevalonate kinase [Anaerolineales bacterium]|nr:mevalonate kinase [Anaerolineales bacterium]
MPAISANAPGKTIIFGEHAVVYGHPAIAIPVPSIKAQAITLPHIHGQGVVRIIADDIGLDSTLDDLDEKNPLRVVLETLFNHTGIHHPPGFILKINSTIPIASGLGSGAAVSVAVVRSVSQFLGRQLSLEEISTIAYEGEKILHGTPSGIDNTVITYNCPVYFIRNLRIETFKVNHSIHLVIGNTGVPAATVETVGTVRNAWKKKTDHYEEIFSQIGNIAISGKEALIQGNLGYLGALMNQNQVLLRDLGVSSPKLEVLIEAALSAGSLGAKLCGGGGGGNMIALADETNSQHIADELLEAGATSYIITSLTPKTRGEDSI